LRKFVFALILFLGIVFLFTRFSEIEVIASTLQKGDWRFLTLALFVQGLWLINMAASYQAIFQLIGIEEDLKDMIVISSAVSFANIVAPMGGMSGIAILMDRARRRGYSTARSAIANSLYIEFDYVGFLAILALGLVVLMRRDNLNLTELLASGVLLSAATGLAALIYLGTRSTSALEKALVFLARGANRLAELLLRRQMINEERVIGFAREAAAGLQLLRKQPKKIVAPLLLGLSSKILLMVNLSLMFLAFQVPISIGTIIAGFSIAFLFLIVSPTPSGLGFVEGALTLSLGSMYIPLGTAVVLTVAYRAYTFWLPLGIGLIAFRWIERMHPPKV
jgi:glycosyltransferase 2 family protein